MFRAFIIHDFFQPSRFRYLKERFGWMEVTEEAIDNVIDNSESIELGLDDRCKQAVRHAVGQEKAVVFAYVSCRAISFPWLLACTLSCTCACVFSRPDV